jgi:monoamine oxidase
MPNHLPFENVSDEQSALVDFFRGRQLNDLPQGGGKSVAVVGAGIGGLVTAYELSTRGFAVDLFERSHTVGGRIHTHRFSSGCYGELGAMRVPKSHLAAMDYLVKLDVPVREFANWNNKGRFYFKGHHGKFTKDVGSGSAEHELNIRKCFAGIKSINEGDFLTGILPCLKRLLIDRLSEELSTDDFLGFIHTNSFSSKRVQEVLTSTLKQFAASADLSNDDYSIVSRLSGIAPLDTCSIQQFIIDTIPILGVQMFEIVGGMDAFPLALLESSNVRNVFLSTNVLRISHKAKTVVIETSKDKLTFDYAVIAIPPGSLSSLIVDGAPPFIDISREISGLTMRPLSKTLLSCRCPFWSVDSELRYGGFVSTDLPITQVWYPSSITTAESPQVLVGSYHWADYAKDWMQLSQDEILEAVFNGISRIHGLDRHQLDLLVDDVAIKHWPEGYTLFEHEKYRSLTNKLTAYYRSLPRIFFAGEHMSASHGWMVSAILPAQYAVESICHAVENNSNS